MDLFRIFRSIACYTIVDSMLATVIFRNILFLCLLRALSALSCIMLSEFRSSFDQLSFFSISALYYHITLNLLQLSQRLIDLLNLVDVLEIFIFHDKAEICMNYLAHFNPYLIIVQGNQVRADTDSIFHNQTKIRRTKHNTNFLLKRIKFHSFDRMNLCTNELLENLLLILL